MCLNVECGGLTCIRGNCQLIYCDGGLPCFNNGICNGQTCQCSQENGIAKYHGESCEMPGRDPCDQNPCQNGGTCSTISSANIQVCFIRKIVNFSFHYLYDIETS